MSRLIEAREQIAAVLEEFAEEAERELGLRTCTNAELERGPLPEPWVPDDPVVKALREVRRVCDWATYVEGARER